MNLIAIDDLMSFAVTLEGTRLPTISNKAKFILHVLPEGIQITPESSSRPRLVRRKYIEKFCREYRNLKSMRVIDYREITFDASYLLAIVDRYERRPKL